MTEGDTGPSRRRLFSRVGSKKSVHGPQKSSAGTGTGVATAAEDYLRNAPMFAVLCDEDKRKLAQSLTLRVFAPGETLIRKGQAGTTFFILKSGTVGFIVDKSGAVNHTYNTAGQYFGDIALRSETSLCTATAVTTMGCECYVLDKPTFTRLVAPIDRDHRQREMRREYEAAYIKRNEAAKGNGVWMGSSDEHGPFVTLAFEGGRNSLERVRIGKKHHKALRRWLWSMAAFALCMLYATLIIGTGFMDIDNQFHKSAGLVLKEEDADPHTLTLQMAHLIYPPPGCVVSPKFETAYSILLLAIVVPAGCINSVVLPAWILTLQLATVLAADNIADMMERLDPTHFFVDLQICKLDNTGSVDGRRAAWYERVQVPGALLVTTMHKLCDWNTSMSVLIFGSILQFIGIYPYATVMGFHQLITCCYGIFATLVLLAYAPVALSSACDHLMEQLNEVSFLGQMGHKDRCDRLYPTPSIQAIYP